VSFSVLFVCTCVLPPGGYPIAVKYISYHIFPHCPQNSESEKTKSRKLRKYLWYTYLYVRARGCLYILQHHIRGKMNPCRGMNRPRGFQSLRPPPPKKKDIKLVKVVSPTHRPPLLPRKYSWYSFLLEVASTPGP
jgi:hypothetical protein